jgi:hypothetical protein
MLNNHDLRTANHIAAIIEKHPDLYESSAAFKAMVDSTVLFTDDERHESERVIGGQYAGDGRFVNL